MSGFYLLAAAVADDSGGVIRQTTEAFGINWPLFLSQTISFCIVAFLLHRFAYRPILSVLEERRQRIAEGLANAENIKAELARTEEARKQVLDTANNQANQLIEEARNAAARVLEQETQKAIATAEQIIARAREAAEADHARMLTELRREIGRLVVQTTARVTGKVLTVDDQRRLIDDTNKELAA
jgi:F-type H+-transporting ATPase subunit b